MKNEKKKKERDLYTLKVVSRASKAISVQGFKFMYRLLI